MGTTTVKKQPTAAQTKSRNPQVYNEYYDLLKVYTSENAKIILGKKYDRSPSAINTILVNERKKRNKKSRNLKFDQVAA